MHKCVEAKRNNLNFCTSHVLKIDIIIFLFQVCTNLFCFYMYRSVSVFKLPAEWLEPHPIPRLVSWPSNEAGGISFLFWFTVSSQVFRLLKTRWKWVYVQSWTLECPALSQSLKRSFWLLSDRDLQSRLVQNCSSHDVNCCVHVSND